MNFTAILLALLAAVSILSAQTSPAPARILGEETGYGEKFVLGHSQMLRWGNILYLTDRAGNMIYEEYVGHWWEGRFGNEGGGGITFGYDPVAGRWIAASYDTIFTYGNDGIYIAVSHTSDFMGKWTRFHFSEDSVQGDEDDDLDYEDHYSLRLGYGGGMVAATLLVNDYEGRNSDFQEDDSGYVIVALGDFAGGTGDTPLTARQHIISHEEFPYDGGKPVPARTWSATNSLMFFSMEEESPARYAAHKLSFSGTQFTFSRSYLAWTLSNLASDSGYVEAPQPQTTHLLIHTDEWGSPGFMGKEIIPAHRQIRDVMVRDGHLWAVHEAMDSSAGVVRAQWLEANLTGYPYQIVQRGRIGGGGDSISCLAPSISVNANHDVLVGFTATGPHHFPSAAYAMRYGTDAANTMRGLRLFAAGTEPYIHGVYYNGRTFWNDYTYTQADPADPNGLWTCQLRNTDYISSFLAQVTGSVPPAITAQPQNRTVAPNQSASFTVAATGTNLEYQWFHEDDSLGFGHNATVTVNSANAATAGYYRCRIRNESGEIWSDAALLKLTTGNPGVFSWSSSLGVPLSTVTWQESLIQRTRTIYVKRSNGSDGRVRVAVNVQGHFDPFLPSATAGWDFTPIKTSAPGTRGFAGPGALIFEPGETLKPVTVTIRNDSMVEPSLEGMRATMTVDPALGAVSGDGILPIYLEDNDTSPTFATAVDYNTTWTNPGSRWKPQISDTSDGVDAVQTDITPPGGDEAAFSANFTVDGTLFWRWRANGDAGDTLRLELQGTIGRPSTPAEIFGGSSWQSAAAPVRPSLTGTTTASWAFQRGANSTNEFAGGFVDQIRFHAGMGGVMEIAQSSYTVDENAGTVQVKLRRLGHNSESGLIGVSLEGITATEGTDFQNLTTAIYTFSAGQTERTLTFNIFPDQIVEPVETFRVVLSTVSGGDIGVAHQGTAIVSIIDRQEETYAGWAATKFTSPEMNVPSISGPEADPDKDGVKNLLEYALDGEPKNAASAPAPSSLMLSYPGESVQYLQFGFVRRKLASDLRYAVQHSTDMQTWQDAAVFTPDAPATHNPALVELLSTTGDPLETRTLRSAQPVAEATRVWMRLGVTLQ